jgi:hypothetical protein
MNRRTWIALAAVASATGLGAGCRSRPPPTDVERIRALFDRAARAAEARKPAEVVELLSERFQGQAPEVGERASRDDVRRLLALQLMSGQWVSVSIHDAQVVVEGVRARAAVDAVLSRSADRGKGLEGLLPGEFSIHRFQLDLEREGENWRVVSGSWRQIGLDEALSGPGTPDW